VEEGDQISAFYDPMIAKLVTTGDTREEAIWELASKVSLVECAPVKTNAWFLARLLWRPEFQQGGVSTGFIAEHEAALLKPPESRPALLQQAADLAVFNEELHGPTGQTGVDARLSGMVGFRLNAARQRNIVLSVNGERVEVDFANELAAFEAYWSDKRNGLVVIGERAIFFDDGAAFITQAFQPRGTGTSHGVHDGEIEAPMPGRVTAVEVSQGEKVAKGQRLLTLEAMKMEHALTAPFDGTVAEVNATAGAQVSEGQLLVKVTPEEK
jgi:3-methylcrotonyl-CoA carboxylase alpha subunit